MNKFNDLDKVNAILNNAKFNQELEKINQQERERIFCKHGLEHLLDVARIMYIRYLEALTINSLNYNTISNLNKEIIYATALLHDLGRAEEYELRKRPHAAASADMAKEILIEAGFHVEDSKLICNAIANHNNAATDKLSDWLQEADWLSRNCYRCTALDECNWVEARKNKEITV